MSLAELSCPHCGVSHQVSLGPTVKEIPCSKCNRQIDVSSFNPEEFWADTVKKMKQQGLTREIVEIGQKHIPFPGAFTEIAIVIRKEIRRLRKEKADTKDLLNELYKWAVIQNFCTRLPWNSISAYSFDICHSTTIECAKDIKAPYNKIGYENLDLLNKTDVKWLVEAFGEPKSHTDAVKGNPGLLKKSKETFRLAEKEAEQQYWEEAGFDGPPDDDDEIPASYNSPSSAGQKSGCLTSILLIVSVVLLMCIYL